MAKRKFNTPEHINSVLNTLNQHIPNQPPKVENKNNVVLLKKIYIYEGVEKKQQSIIEKQVMKEFIEELCNLGYLEYSKKTDSNGKITFEFEISGNNLQELKQKIAENKKNKENDTLRSNPPD